MLLCISNSMMAEDEWIAPDDFSNEVISYIASDNFPEDFNYIRCDRNHLIQGRYVFFYFDEKFSNYSVEAWADITEFEDFLHPGVIHYTFRNNEDCITLNIEARNYAYFYEYIKKMNQNEKDLRKLPKVMTIHLKSYKNFFFLKDVDFDNEDEVLFIQAGMAQRNEHAYAVYDWESYGDFKKCGSPFLEFDYSTEIDYKNKRIIINGIGGASRHYQDIYCIDEEEGTFYLYEQREYGFDDGDLNNCKVTRLKKQHRTIKTSPQQNTELILPY